MPTASLTKPTAAPVTTERAWGYLRVSGGPRQTKTDYDPEGLSIGAQREAATDKALQLGAEVVREFSDPGKSAYVDLHKRLGFLEMLDELKRCNENEATRVDYVIVWSLSRWARNQKDYWQTRELVRDAGAQLVSVSEPMIGDGSAASFFTESIIAAKNQYESMQTSENVKNSIYQKAKRGGTYGWTRLGYLNTVDRLADGRKVAIAVPDRDCQHFLTFAFQLYATGEYSVSQLRDELYRLGLRSRPRKQRPAQQVGTTSLQRILRDAYYAGWIVYKRGTPDEETFRGRHDALIDQDTFDRVQALLDEKNTAGERTQIRHHYLRGSIFCGDCGHRLAYGFSRSKSGRRYPYFFCVSRTRGVACTMHTSIRPQLIEEAITRYYRERPIQLTANDVAKRTEAIEALAAVSEQAVVQVREAKTALIAKLKAQQTRLIRLHAEEGDEVSPDAFRDERLRMATEIQAAEKSLAETELRLTIETQQLKMALELAQDVAHVYAQADDATKRSFNQAFFKKLYVTPEWDEGQGQTTARIASADLTPPYALLLADDLVPGVLAEVERITGKPSQRQKRAPGSQSSSPKPLFGGCSYFDVMAEREGFEPSNEVSPVTRFPVAPVQPLRHLSRRLHRRFEIDGGVPKATTPAPVALLGSQDARGKQSLLHDRRSDRDLRRHRRGRQRDHRFHRRADPRRASSEPGISSLTPPTRRIAV
jgi:site-specific DNA recombinase